jgi:hypothetical protein
MKKGGWSEEEVNTLFALYPTHTNAELSEILNRSHSAINTKAYKLGLKKSEETISRAMSTRYDSELESLNKLPIDEVPLDTAFKHVEWLKFHYYDREFSLPDIAEITGTTRKNVEYWMNKFGLDRRNDRDRFTDRCLRKIAETSKGRVPFSKGLTKHDHPSIMKISEKLSGENNYWWNGGIHMTSSGYKMITSREHPYANRDGYVLEHRLVVEATIGRFLTPMEVVHHRDQNRLNNHPGNLFIFPDNASHLRFHTYKTWNDPGITEEQFMEEVYELAYNTKG